MIGEVSYYKCSECGEVSYTPIGDRELILEKSKGIKWPDRLGDGSELLFTVSDRVLEDWKNDGIGDYPIHKVTIRKPYPKKLAAIEPPRYFWIDGKRIVRAKINLEASGYVNARLCEGCGRLIYDIAATYARKESGIWPYVFVPGAWNDANLFTTDMSPNKFFCTEKVIECAHRHKHLNFRFTPIELGDASGYKGIDYLGAKIKWDK